MAIAVKAKLYFYLKLPVAAANEVVTGPLNISFTHFQ